MLTVGALPNAPVAVTDEFAPTDEDDDEDEDDLDDEEDEPQPARTAPPSNAMAMSARKRRMKTSMSWILAPPAYWLCWPRGTNP
jgi:hypothetical protein